MSRLFISCGQTVGASTSASTLLINDQDLFALVLTGLISLQSKGLSRVFSNTTGQKHQFFTVESFLVQLSHPFMTTGKNIVLTRQTLFGKVMSLLFNILSSVCHNFHSKEQASFNFMAAVTICSDFRAQEDKVCHCFRCFPVYLP